jgi:hypothetical protein
MDVDKSILAQGCGPLSGWRQTVPLSELEAATQAAACLQGDLKMLIDASYVVRGIRRGPDYQHAHHQHQWRQFWRTVGDRAVEAIKVKAHQTQAAAEANGVTDLEWSANQAADALAEQAALAAQLPAAAIAAVQHHDAEALAVQSHLLAVAREVARAAPRLYGPSSRYQRREDAAQRARARRPGGRGGPTHPTHNQ